MAQEAWANRRDRATVTALAASARLSDSEPMRATFARFSAVFLMIGSALALASALAVALAACPAPKMPKGPSPEYEDPPAPSWLDAGPRGHGTSDGGAPPASTLPGSELAPPPPAS